jgi:hypothetical protein
MTILAMISIGFKTLEFPKMLLFAVHSEKNIFMLTALEDMQQLITA